METLAAARNLSQLHTMPTTSAAASTNQFFINNLNFIGKSALAPDEYYLEHAGFKNDEEEERVAAHPAQRLISKSPQASGHMPYHVVQLQQQVAHPWVQLPEEQLPNEVKACQLAQSAPSGAIQKDPVDLK